MKSYQLFWLFAVLIFNGCSSDDSGNSSNNSTTDDPSDPIANTNTPNILLIIADDMGLDATPGYSIGASKPNMPRCRSWVYEFLYPSQSHQLQATP